MPMMRRRAIFLNFFFHGFERQVFPDSWDTWYLTYLGPFFASVFFYQMKFWSALISGLGIPSQVCNKLLSPGVIPAAAQSGFSRNGIFGSWRREEGVKNQCSTPNGSRPFLEKGWAKEKVMLLIFSSGWKKFFWTREKMINCPRWPLLLVFLYLLSAEQKAHFFAFVWLSRKWRFSFDFATYIGLDLKFLRTRLPN